MIKKFLILEKDKMNDIATGTQHQNTNTQPNQPIKKNFFGGEVPTEGIQEIDPISPIEEEIEETDEIETDEDSGDSDLFLFEDKVLSEDEALSENEVLSDENTYLEAFDPFGEEDDDSRDASVARPNDNENTNDDDRGDMNDDDNEHTNDEEEKIEKEPYPTSEIFTAFQKFINIAREIFTLLPEGEQFFKITGNKTEDSLTEYDNYLVEDEENNIDIFIKKTDVNHEEEEEHLLQRSYNTEQKKLNIFVDEILLYEYDEQQTNTQISGKLDKFIFLYETFHKELSKKYLEQQETENKRKQLNEIFRNF